MRQYRACGPAESSLPPSWFVQRRAPRPGDSAAGRSGRRRPAALGLRSPAVAQRKDRPRRHHRSGEPQLRQSVPRISRRRHAVVRLHEHRKKVTLAPFGLEPTGTSITARNRSLPPATAGEHSRHQLQDGRLRQRAAHLRPRAAPVPELRRRNTRYVPQSETKPYFVDGAAVRLGRPNVRLELRRQQFHLASIHHRRPGQLGGRLSR